MDSESTMVNISISAQGSSSNPSWQKPEITTFEIKRTMNLNGSGKDTNTGSKGS